MPSSEPLVLYRRITARLRRSNVEEFAHVLLERVAGGRGFCCLITNDREVERLNAEFRGKHYATDVLSFPSNGPAGMPVPSSLGDVAISAERAAEQARRFGHSL